MIRPSRWSRPTSAVARLIRRPQRRHATLSGSCLASHSILELAAWKVGFLMGFSMRTFFIDGETILPVSQARFERILDGKESLPEHADQQIQVAEIFIELANRQPIGSVRESYYWLPFDGSGFADKSALLEHANVAIEATLDRVPLPSEDAEHDTVVVQASARFAERRLKETIRWEPGHRLRKRILELALGKRKRR